MATDRQNVAHFSYLLNDDGAIVDCIPFRGEQSARRSLDDRDGWRYIGVPFGEPMQQAIAKAEAAKAARLAAQQELPAEIVEGITSKTPPSARKRAAGAPKTGVEA